MTTQTTTTTEMRSGVCECGTPVMRPAGDGAWAAFIDRMPFVCAACQARAEEHDREHADEFERDARIRRHQRRIAASGIPDRYAGLRLDQTASRGGDLAREWVRSATDDNATRRGLVLTGPVGVGKTHLAAAAAGSLLDHRPVRWLTGPLLLARLGTGLGTREHDDMIRVLLGRTPMVLDDLDKARATEYAAEQVFTAVDSRVSENVPLLVTTNLELRELADRWPSPYGEAVVSRLAGFCVVVRMSGPDRRMAA